MASKILRWLSLRIYVNVIPSSRCYSVPQVPGRNCLRSPWSIAHEALAHCEAARSRVRRAVIVVLVDDRVDHDCLFVDSDGAVCGYRDPIVCQHLCQYSERSATGRCVNVGCGYPPLSKVKGSLATSTISAPLSLLSILYWPGPSPCFQLVPEEKYRDAASSVVLLTYLVHTTL